MEVVEEATPVLCEGPSGLLHFLEISPILSLSSHVRVVALSSLFCAIDSQTRDGTVVMWDLGQGEPVPVQVGHAVQL